MSLTFKVAVTLEIHSGEKAKIARQMLEGGHPRHLCLQQCVADVIGLPATGPVIMALLDQPEIATAVAQESGLEDKPRKRRKSPPPEPPVEDD